MKSINDLNLVMPTSWNEVSTKKGLVIMKTINKFGGEVNLDNIENVIELISVLCDIDKKEFEDVSFIETFNYIKECNLDWLAEIK
jgi:hypothetical protein